MQGCNPIRVPVKNFSNWTPSLNVPYADHMIPFTRCGIFGVITYSHNFRKMFAHTQCLACFCAPHTYCSVFRAGRKKHPVFIHCNIPNLVRMALQFCYLLMQLNVHYKHLTTFCARNNACPVRCHEIRINISSRVATHINYASRCYIGNIPCHWTCADRAPRSQGGHCGYMSEVSRQKLWRAAAHHVQWLVEE